MINHQMHKRCNFLNNFESLVQTRICVKLSYLNFYRQCILGSVSLERKMLITETRTAVIDNLIPYTNYSIGVLGYTAAGDGVSSRPIYATTSQDKPEAPMNIKVFMKDPNTLLVVWTPPDVPNGVLTQYKVYCDRFRTKVSQDASLETKIEYYAFSFKLKPIKN